MQSYCYLQRNLASSPCMPSLQGSLSELKEAVAHAL